MAGRIKITRNSPCPCMSGKKYKRCCEGLRDWESILRDGERTDEAIAGLSLRGRYSYFMSRVYDILGVGPNSNLEEYKRAFTASAVRDIHEAILSVWPPDMNISEVLSRERTEVSGLYVGDYSQPFLARGLVRHSLYANRILVVDPLIYPPTVRDEYNPILNPYQYRAQTLRNINFLRSLLPWVDAGIVSVIRTPDDFDPRLKWDSMKRQDEKFRTNNAFRAALEEGSGATGQMMQRHRDAMAFRDLVMSAPDEHLVRILEEARGAVDNVDKDISTEDLVAYVRERRAKDPDFLEPLSTEGNSQLSFITTGANHEIAKITAGLTGSYLVTDLEVRWKEIEFDRNNLGPYSSVWASLAKALQEADLHYLNDLSLGDALHVRREARLEGLRSLFARIWKEAKNGEDYDSANAILLANELTDQIKRSEAEWKRLRSGLIAQLGGAATTGLLAAGPLIASGHGAFVAAAGALASGAALAYTHLGEKRFQTSHPAGFFMNIGNDK